MNEEMLFNSALEKSAGERAAFLDAACAGESALRQRIELLLKVHENPGSFLRGPAADLELTEGVSPHERAAHDRPDDCDHASVGSRRAAEGPGSRIGPYKLLQQIGEGGMGSVFMAEQVQPVQRMVALKIIKPGMDSRQVIARFEAERQALALMDHPNIAKVHDASTTESGRPYFVMELVRGVPLKTFCDERLLTPRERLELFIPICQAVQHAHQKGIVHRDLKPSNVLIALYDGRPVPKVIDFGVAKATGPKLTDRTLFTEFGSVVGTLEYMSPEQAELNQLDIDTRSDIYSLGVLLYELLTDSTPLARQRVQKTGLLEVLRLIREEDPPRPSVRLSTTEELPTIAARRGLDSARLKGQIRGELDWIAMKALEKDRNRRYQTANALARDIERFLNDDTVEACPPSARYRLTKFLRRHKRGIGIASVFASTLAIAAAVSIYLAVRATQAEIQARSSQIQAEANLGKAHQAVNEFFTRVSDDTLLNEPALEPLRRQLLLTALPYYDGFVREHREDPAFQAELAATYFRIGILTFELGPEEDWVPAMKLGVDTLENLLRKKSALPTLKSLHAGFRWVNTGAPFHVRQSDEALRVFEKARLQWEHLVSQHPTVTGFQSDLAGVNLVLGVLQDSHFQIEDAVETYRDACLRWRRLIEINPEATHYPTPFCIASANLSIDLAVLRQSTESKKFMDECVSTATTFLAKFPNVHAFEDLHSGYVELCRGILGEHTGRLEEAESAYRRAVAGQEQLLRVYASVARFRKGAFTARSCLGEVLWAKGLRAEAAECFRIAISHGEQLGEADPVAQNNLAWFLTTVADPQFRDHPKAVRIARTVVERVPQNRENWITLGVAQYSVGDYQNAALSLEKAIRGPYRFAGCSALYLAMAYWQLGQKEQARHWYDRAIEQIESFEVRDLEHSRLQRTAECLLKIVPKERRRSNSRQESGP
jgi:serine/threonine protein kinase/tetratricopeptide (TPR) repeat protein